jgi:hypothetical protein
MFLVLFNLDVFRRHAERYSEIYEHVVDWGAVIFGQISTGRLAPQYNSGRALCPLFSVLSR